MTSDPKPDGRRVASQAEWREIRRQVLADGKCLVKGCTTKATDVHHLIPRSLRGSDVIDNLIPLCHLHHMQYEDRMGMVDVLIGQALPKEKVEYMIAAKGPRFVERYYGRACA